MGLIFFLLLKLPALLFTFFGKFLLLFKVAKVLKLVAVPFLLLGLLPLLLGPLLLLAPLLLPLLLALPIPVLQPANTAAAGRRRRDLGNLQFLQSLLESEKCLERIACVLAAEKDPTYTSTVIWGLDRLKPLIPHPKISNYVSAYLPKLEKLASSLTGMGSPPGTRARPKPKKTTKKIVLVKKPTYEQLPPPTMMPPYRQPGMVYVPATWVKKNPPRSNRIGRSEDISARHTMSSLAKRRLSLRTDENILVQQKPPKNNKALVKRKINPKLDKHVKDEILSLGAKKAAVVLERKRLEFLQYLQEVQEEISALGFSDHLMKPKTRNKKRDVNQLPKPKIKKRASVKKDNTNVSKGRTPKTPNKRGHSKVEYSKNNVNPVESNLIDSKHSLTSMLSQESSSSTQIRMMDDAFNSNHRNYKASINESKQTKINLGGPPLSELPGFFQWSPIPTSRSTNSTIRIA